VVAKQALNDNISNAVDTTPGPGELSPGSLHSWNDKIKVIIYKYNYKFEATMVLKIFNRMDGCWHFFSSDESE
jgi:hypothetical protein